MCALRELVKDDTVRNGIICICICKYMVKKSPTLTAVRFYLQQAFARVSRHQPQETSPCEFGPFAKTDRFDSAGHDL